MRRNYNYSYVIVSVVKSSYTQYFLQYHLRLPAIDFSTSDDQKLVDQHISLNQYLRAISIQELQKFCIKELRRKISYYRIIPRILHIKII